MPTTLNFSQLFGKSPFKPMKEHMKITRECVQHIAPAVEAFFINDNSTLKSAKRTVSQLESDADRVIEELQNRLPSSMFLPVHRRDLLDVLEMQEAIADRTEDIVGLMLDLPMEVPEEMHEPILNLTHRAYDAVSTAYEIIACFEELVETGFKGPDAEKAHALIRQVVAIETDADHIGIDITHTLFAHAREMDPVSVVFLHRLIGWIDDLADYSETLAIRARLLLAK